MNPLKSVEKKTVHFFVATHNFICGFSAKSGIAIFAWRVTWNYAYSPFNLFILYQILLFFQAWQVFNYHNLLHCFSSYKSANHNSRETTIESNQSLTTLPDLIRQIVFKDILIKRTCISKIGQLHEITPTPPYYVFCLVMYKAL